MLYRLYFKFLVARVKMYGSKLLTLPNVVSLFDVLTSDQDLVTGDKLNTAVTMLNLKEFPETVHISKN